LFILLSDPSVKIKHPNFK